MSIFWLLVAAMIAIALLFIVPPILRAKSIEKADHNAINTAVIKEQLNELEGDLESGKLDKTAYIAARHDLERALLDDLHKSEASNDSERSGRWASGLLALAVPAAALFIYHQLGSQTALSPDTQKVAAVTDESGHSLESMINKLAIRLQENPDDIEGWIILANSYAAVNQFDKSAAAYKEVLQRTGGNHPQILTDYADTLAMASGGDFTEEVGDLLKTALRLEPDNIKALWLMGHWHYQRNQYDASLKNWKHASTLLPPNSENAAALNQQIRLVENEMGIVSTETTPAQQKVPVVTSGTAIQVSVSLDPALKEKASPEDTLFIYARAVKGPRMPLAIVRKQVKDLPITVTLDDSQAMSPQMILSNFPEVSVSARISKTGNAITASGDLKGEQSPVAVGTDNEISVIIDSVTP